MLNADVSELATVFRALGLGTTEQTYLRRAKVTAVANGKATIVLGDATIAGVSFYRSAVPVVGDAVDILFDGGTPRIVGVMADSAKNYSPGMVKIAEVKLAAIGTVDFPAIPQTFSALKVIGSVRIGSGAGIYFNANPGVGTQSYDNSTYQFSFGVGAATRGATANEARGFIGNTTADVSGQLGYSSFEWTVTDYADSRPRNFHSRVWGGLDDAPFEMGSVARLFDQTPVTALQFLHSNGLGFGIGTHVTLYGLA